MPAWSPGAREVLEQLGAGDGVVAAVISGRPLRELRDQFGFDDGVRLIGSHGLEDSECPTPALDAGEQHRLAEIGDELRTLAGAVPGAWVEDKPAAAVLHVREATTSEGDGALAHAGVRLGERAGVFLIPGHRVLEVDRAADEQGGRPRRLRAETGAATVVFAGDDVADEEAMATLGPGDVGIRVGREPSLARTGWVGRPTWSRCSTPSPRDARARFLLFFLRRLKAPDGQLGHEADVVAPGCRRRAPTPPRPCRSRARGRAASAAPGSRGWATTGTGPAPPTRGRRAARPPAGRRTAGSTGSS